jgi:SAM-dependent methyltransferase
MSRACPICDGADAPPFHVVQGRELLICSRCRHIFWAARAQEHELVAFYATQYGWSHQQQSTQSNNLAYYDDHVSELLAKHGPASADVCLVDVGCSYPCLLEAAHRRGYTNVIGVDWDQGAHAYGRERGLRMMTPPDFLRETPPETVDILRFSHTIEHLIDPRKSLNDAVAKLKPGGLLYVTQPNFPVFAVGAGGVELKDAVWPEHLHFFSPLSLCHLVTSLGFEIVTFFTHTNADNVITKYGPQLDLALAAQLMSDYAQVGESFAGQTGNYPAYAGENSCLYARRLKVPLATQHSSNFTRQLTLAGEVLARERSRAA